VICAGLDLGQSVDHAALVIGRARARPLAVKIEYVRQFPLNTSYALIVAEVVKTLNLLPKDPITDDVSLAVDRRGPGGPVVDMLAATPGLNIKRLLAISSTSASAARRQPPLPADPVFLERWFVPKQLLFRTLLGLINSGRFAVAEILGADRLRTEFERFEFRLTERTYIMLDGHGCPDDILLSVVMSCWAAITTKTEEESNEKWSLD